jgi:hypothetical protein
VTFTPSSFRTSLSGDGKKSLTISNLPNASSVYFTVRLINLPSSTPKAGADNTNSFFPEREANSEDTEGHLPEAIEPFLSAAVGNVPSNDAIGV